ncbi:hypothetical protein GL218_05012 [Daldinia childiae]|uniref:uncharacterized protein n=1 Tax=Daldinia childiae TaxID=326645 RepID=UPI0014459FD3|nr:uncharacterized protein GL218_05012 [Daldinia childiae]KAF3059805.1 hypothetical protein GL218_05012 [Daldinia childiae]
MPDDPAEKTANILRGWTRESNFDELLVVYYVGDGSRSSRGPVPQPFRVARRDSSGNFDASIDWPVIHSVLEAAQCDIVMFLNCCHGADAWVSRNLEEDGFKGPPNKVMCIIAATSENETVCMHEQMSFGTLLKNVLDSVRPGLGLKKSISIPMLVKAMKDEIERSKSFRVKDVVHGGMWLMDPCLYEQGDGEYRNILLHRTLGEHDISEIVPLVVIGHTWYQPLLGLAGQYWRLLRVTESELDERH